MPTSTRRSPFPILLIFLGILFILNAVVLFNTFQPDNDSPTEQPVVQESQSTEPPRVSLNQAKAAFDSQEAVFVDVRDSASYAENHIPGSISIPLAELETRISELDPDDWIITYCT